MRAELEQFAAETAEREITEATILIEHYLKHHSDHVASSAYSIQHTHNMAAVIQTTAHQHTATTSTAIRDLLAEIAVDHHLDQITDVWLYTHDAACLGSLHRQGEAYTIIDPAQNQSWLVTVDPDQDHPRLDEPPTRNTTLPPPGLLDLSNGLVETQGKLLIHHASAIVATTPQGPQSVGTLVCWSTLDNRLGDTIADMTGARIISAPDSHPVVDHGRLITPDHGHPYVASSVFTQHAGNPGATTPIFIEFPPDRLIENQRESILRMLIIVGIGSTVSLLIIIGSIATFTRPLKNLTNAVLELKQGMWNQNIPDPGSPELSPLVTAINQMQADLSLSFETLQRSHDRFRILIDQVPAFFEIHDHRGTYVLVNQALAKALDSTPNELQGLSLRDFHGTAISLPSLVILDQHTSQRQLIREDPRFPGRTFQCVQFRLPKGEGWEFCTLSVDISDQVMVQERLRQSEKMQLVGQMASGIAHDFNNQLQIIGGYAHLLAKETMSADAKHKLELIRKTCQRSGALTQQLLAFSRQGTLKQEVIDLSSMVKELAEMVQVGLGSKNRLVLECDAGNAVIEGDRTSLQNLILNLVLNARDALGQKGGTVTIQVGDPNVENPVPTSELEIITSTEQVGTCDEDQADWIRIEVSDDGPGIAPDIIHRIFDPFFSTKQHNDRSNSGTGLGLAAALGTVNEHEGRMRLRSVLGQGASFSIFLHRSSQIHHQSVELVVDSTDTIHFVLVDDEVDILEMIAECAADFGHQVTTFKDGPSTLAWIDKEHPRIDAAVLDVNMPNMDGSELAKQIHQRLPDLPIVVATGLGPNNDDPYIRSDNRITVLRKPYNILGLLKALRAHILDTSGRSRQNPVLPD